MSLLILIFALTGLTALGWAGATFYEFLVRVRHDRRAAEVGTPRSPRPETFDPRRRAA